MRRAGIDPGSVRTGVAIADDEVPVATPLCTVQHRGLAQGAARVAELLVRERIEMAVVGLPLNLSGREGDAAQRAREFARRLEGLAHVQVVLWDERLTSVEASRVLAEARYNRAAPARARRPTRTSPVRGARGEIDSAAATLILQSYLDSQRERPWPVEPTQISQTRDRNPSDGDNH